MVERTLEEEQKDKCFWNSKPRGAKERNLEEGREGKREELSLAFKRRNGT